jgi:hypothetical protein
MIFCINMWYIVGWSFISEERTSKLLSKAPCAHKKINLEYAQGHRILLDAVGRLYGHWRMSWHDLLPSWPQLQLHPGKFINKIYGGRQRTVTCIFVTSIIALNFAVPM